MKRIIALLAALACCAAAGSVYGLYKVYDHGAWPKSWPAELEPLRKQARTYEGPVVLYRFYLIPFTKREEFEAAWPHLLKVKSKGVPIVLVRGPKTDFFAINPAGVLIRTPPVNDAQGAGKEVSLELVVDGEVVDLNRIPLPPDTPIFDERFNESKKK